MNKKNLIISLGIAGASVVLIITVTYGPIFWSSEEPDEEKHQDIDSHDIVVVTRNATMISTVFATLNGELVDMGNFSSVEVYFVWGESPGEYTMETPKQLLTSPGEFSAEITDLFMPDNTYYFQAHSDPEGSGEDVSFYVY